MRGVLYTRIYTGTWLSRCLCWHSLVHAGTTDYRVLAWLRLQSAQAGRYCCWICMGWYGDHTLGGYLTILLRENTYCLVSDSLIIFIIYYYVDSFFMFVWNSRCTQFPDDCWIGDMSYVIHDYDSGLAVVELCRRPILFENTDPYRSCLPHLNGFVNYIKSTGAQLYFSHRVIYMLMYIYIWYMELCSLLTYSKVFRNI